MKNRLGITITCTNNKGGVGKTSTVRAIAYSLSKEYKVLLVDFDPQRDLSLWHIEHDSKAITDVILGERDIQDVIIKTSRPNIDILPSDTFIFEAEEYIKKQEDSENVLNTRLEEIKNDYDYILIDTSPFFDTLVLNAIVSSDYVIIPTKLDADSIQGAISTKDEIDTVNNVLKMDIKYKVLITMRSPNTRAKQVLSSMQSLFSDNIFKETIRFQDAPFTNISFERDYLQKLYPYTPVSKEYKAVIKELEKWLCPIGHNPKTFNPFKAKKVNIQKHSFVGVSKRGKAQLLKKDAFDSEMICIDPQEGLIKESKNEKK